MRGGDVKFRSHSLGESFAYLFNEHHKAISAGLRIRIDQIKEKSEAKGISHKRVIFRTRNYSLKQPEHNTKTEQILPLVNCFIQNGWEVINIGSPALSLISELSPVSKKSYKEFSNEFTIDEEFEQLAFPIVCRADAGLFVLVAALTTPLILLSEEWSTRFGINMIEARALSGAHYDQVEASISKPQVIVDRLQENYVNI